MRQKTEEIKEKLAREKLAEAMARKIKEKYKQSEVSLAQYLYKKNPQGRGFFIMTGIRNGGRYVMTADRLPTSYPDGIDSKGVYIRVSRDSQCPLYYMNRSIDAKPTPISLKSAELQAFDDFVEGKKSDQPIIFLDAQDRSRLGKVSAQLKPKDRCFLLCLSEDWAKDFFSEEGRVLPDLPFYYTGQTSHPMELSISPNKHYLAVANMNGITKVYKFKLPFKLPQGQPSTKNKWVWEGKELNHAVPGQWEDEKASKYLAFTKDSTYLISLSGYNNTVRIFDTTDSKKEIIKCSVHGNLTGIYLPSERRYDYINLDTIDYRICGSELVIGQEKELHAIKLNYKRSQKAERFVASDPAAKPYSEDFVARLRLPQDDKSKKEQKDWKDKNWKELWKEKQIGALWWNKEIKYRYIEETKELEKETETYVYKSPSICIDKKVFNRLKRLPKRGKCLLIFPGAKRKAKDINRINLPEFISAYERDVIRDSYDAAYIFLRDKSELFFFAAYKHDRRKELKLDQLTSLCRDSKKISGILKSHFDLLPEHESYYWPISEEELEVLHDMTGPSQQYQLKRPEEGQLFKEVFNGEFGDLKEYKTRCFFGESSNEQSHYLTFKFMGGQKKNFDLHFHIEYDPDPTSFEKLDDYLREHDLLRERDLWGSFLKILQSGAQAFLKDSLGVHKVHEEYDYAKAIADYKKALDDDKSSTIPDKPRANLLQKKEHRFNDFEDCAKRLFIVFEILRCLKIDEAIQEIVRKYIIPFSEAKEQVGAAEAKPESGRLTQGFFSGKHFDLMPKKKVQKLLKEFESVLNNSYAEGLINNEEHENHLGNLRFYQKKSEEMTRAEYSLLQDIHGKLLRGIVKFSR